MRCKIEKVRSYAKIYINFCTNWYEWSSIGDEMHIYKFKDGATIGLGAPQFKKNIIIYVH